jgi:hypothetical protein
VSALLGRVAIPAGVAALNLAGVGPLRPVITAAELRKAGLVAIGRVLDGMGVQADHVIFGHTHRSGPWPGDDQTEWHTGGGTRLWNTGSWLYERAFLRDRPQENPYWPGNVVTLPDQGDPQLRNVLPDARFPELSAGGSRRSR